MVFARELLAVDLNRQMIERSQGLVGAKGTPIDAILAQAYGAADLALNVRDADIKPQFDRPGGVQ